MRRVSGSPCFFGTKEIVLADSSSSVRLPSRTTGAVQPDNAMAYSKLGVASYRAGDTAALLLRLPFAPLLVGALQP